MTAYDRFDRMEPRLPEILTELAAPSVPDYTDDLLARTAASRQRPRWTFIERWFPMGVIAREQRLLPNVPWRTIAFAALLAALVASALVIVASQRRVPAPFGLASNGALVHDTDGDIYIRDSPTSEPRLLVGGPEYDIAPGFSRDGTRMQFLRVLGDPSDREPDEVAVVVARPDGSGVRQLTGGLQSPDWFDPSPDDRQAVVEMSRNDMPGIHLLDLETGQTQPLYVEMPAGAPMWRGPDGREIIFRGWTLDKGRNRVTLFAIRPDGRGLRPLAPLSIDVENAYQHPQVSPDGRYVLYFGLDVKSRFRVHRLEVDTGRIDVLKLGPDSGHQLYASFSPDNMLLLFHSAPSAGNRIQVMLAPVDGSRPAVALGPEYPVINGSAQLTQIFSPDGRFVIVTQGHDRETRIFDLAEPGAGTVLPWDATGVPSWQRLP